MRSTSEVFAGISGSRGAGLRPLRFRQPAATAHRTSAPPSLTSSRRSVNNTAPRVEGPARRASPRATIVARASAEAERQSEADRANGEGTLVCPGTNRTKFSKVFKFGGSSVANAERMREVAKIVCLFQDEAPIVVLSAMGKTTNNLLLAGESAVQCSASEVESLEPLRAIKELHERTLDELNIDEATRRDVRELMSELSQLLVGLALLKDLTPRSEDSLVSFGERLSTRIFSGYLRSMGVPSLQHDAFAMGILTTDQFTNGDLLYDESIQAVQRNMNRFATRAEVFGETMAEGGGGGDMVPVVPVVTGFLGQGEKTGAITTLGRGGSDLTATFLGLALEIDEVVVWKDVDGVLTSDPRVCPEAKAIPLLTVDEASELAYFGATVLHPQSMQPLVEKQRRARGGHGGITGNGSVSADVDSIDFRVRVRNSYNTDAPGSVICAGRREMADTLLTSIVLKSGVNMLDIVSTRMLGQYGFLSKVFSIFEDLKLSVDVVATR